MALWWINIMEDLERDKTWFTLGAIEALRKKGFQDKEIRETLIEIGVHQEYFDYLIDHTGADGTSITPSNLFRILHYLSTQRPDMIDVLVDEEGEFEYEIDLEDFQEFLGDIKEEEEDN